MITPSINLTSIPACINAKAEGPLIRFEYHMNATLTNVRNILTTMPNINPLMIIVPSKFAQSLSVDLHLHN